MRIDPGFYAAFVAALREEFGDDDVLVADMLEGETDLHDVIGKLLEAEAESDAMAAACRAMSDTYAARAKAHEDRKAAVRGRMHTLLDATGLRKLKHALGTVSLRPTPPRVIFDGDAAALPDDMRRVTIKPDLTAIKAALEAGAVIPGATLTNGGETLAVRR